VYDKYHSCVEIDVSKETSICNTKCKEAIQKEGNYNYIYQTGTGVVWWSQKQFQKPKCAYIEY
jgi:hypothetical protein